MFDFIITNIPLVFNSCNFPDNQFHFRFSIYICQSPHHKFNGIKKSQITIDSGHEKSG